MVQFSLSFVNLKLLDQHFPKIGHVDEKFQASPPNLFQISSSLQLVALWYSLLVGVFSCVFSIEYDNNFVFDYQIFPVILLQWLTICVGGPKIHMHI